MTKRCLLPVLFLLVSIWGDISAGYGQQKIPSGPPPGMLIDIGGRRLHIHCAGPRNAEPTVIFEAGAGAFSADWIAVQKLFEPRVRTCAYDRAGLGWSEAGPAPRTMRQEVFELHALLLAAKISGPFVFVGQSMGGLNVRLYTEEYGNEVAGVVLVDPADESSMLFSLNANRWMKLREQATGRTVPPPRSTGTPSTGYKPEDDYLGDEAQLLYLHRKSNPDPFGDRPLIVLAAGKRPPPPGMTEDAYKDIRNYRNEELVAMTHLSTNSKFMIDPNSSHNLQLDNPQLVAQAIEEVIRAVKEHTKLSELH
jgi:pimeloyl-ACP methyl ester carboxylesterase